MYETGVGYFERTGSLAGRGVALPVPAGHLDDALKTLVVLSDDPQAHIGGIEFASSLIPARARSLAGLPAPVIDRAREILAALERDELTRGGRPSVSGTAGDPQRQLGLFQAQAPADDGLRAKLAAVDVDRMTPLEALTLLAELKRDAGA